MPFWRNATPRVQLSPEAAAAFRYPAVERGNDGMLRMVGTAARAQVLVELRWRPGRSLTANIVPLADAVTSTPASRSLHADHFVLSERGGTLTVVDCRTGAVKRQAEVPGPSVPTPDNRTLVAATVGGLLQLSFRPEAQRPVDGRDTTPMVLLGLDSPRSLALVPDPTGESYTLVIGDYGAAVLVVVRNPRARPADAMVRPIGIEGLPYDPIHLDGPTPLETGQGVHMFMADEGRAGFGAVELATGRFSVCPLEHKGYHATDVRLPKLDGTEALFTDREGAGFRWRPGETPQRVRSLKGAPVLWDGNALLLLDADTGRIWEEPMER